MNEQVRNLCNKLETNRGKKIAAQSYKDKIQFTLVISEILIVVLWSLLGYPMLIAKNISAFFRIKVSSFRAKQSMNSSSAGIYGYITQV